MKTTLFCLIVSINICLAQEVSRYNKGFTKIVYGDDKVLCVGPRTNIIHSLDSIQDITDLFYNSNTGPGINHITTQGFFSNNHFHIYTLDNLSFYPCGDVGFETFTKHTFDEDILNINTHEFIKDYSCYQSNNLLCNGFNTFPNKPALGLINISPKNIFALLKNYLVKIADTTALFAYTTFSSSTILNTGVCLGDRALVFSNYNIFLFDTSGNYISGLNTGDALYNNDFTNAFKVSDTLAIFHLKDSMYSIDNSLNIKYLWNYKTYFDTITEIRNLDGFTYVLGYHSNFNTFKLLQLDNQQTVVNEYNFNINDYKPLGFTISNDSVTIYGNEIVGPDKNEYDLAIKKYSLLNTNELVKNDAAITYSDFQPSRIIDVNGGPYLGMYKFVKGSLNYTIKNFGSDTIKSIIVRSSFSTDPPECGFYANISFYHNNLSLAPGDSIQMNIDTVVYRMAQFPTNQTLCNWTVSPNGKIDKNHINDANCNNYTLVSVKTNSLENDIALFPNPTDNLFYIESDLFKQYNVNISVYNLLGEIITASTGTIAENKQYVDVSKLSNGIYTVVIRYDNNVIIKKITKVD